MSLARRLTSLASMRAVRALAGAMLVVAAALPAAAQAAEPYEVSSFSSRTTDADEADYVRAGGHPFQSTTEFGFSAHEGFNGASPSLLANEELKDALVTLEPGFIGNPAMAPRCRLTDIGEPSFGSPNRCPLDSRVGTASIRFFATPPRTDPQERPLYNVITNRGFPAQFAFRVANTLTILSVVPLPRTEDYGLTIGSWNTPFGINVVTFGTTFCAYGAQGSPGSSSCKAPSGSEDSPFLSNPLDCSNPEPTWKVLADSWENAGTYVKGLPDLANPAWLSASVASPPVEECDAALLATQFNSTSVATKLIQAGGGPVQADQPAGLQVDLDFPQSNDPTDFETEFDNTVPQAPEPKDITVKLPTGLALSPSSANGLDACSDLASDSAGDQVHYDSTKPVSCPDASKIGSALTTSPLLAAHDPIDDHIVGAEPIPGDVYLLKPHPGDLPPGGNQDGKFRLLIQLENADAGINFKLPGVAVADKQTGQLTATFTENPQLPSKHLTVTLKGGPSASLATPATCGRFDTASTLVPWSTPGTPDAHPSASFDVSSGPNGSGCSSSLGTRPFAPVLSAGTTSSKAGATSPFVFKVTRQDGEQELGSVDLTTPPGFTAKLAGVPSCSDAAIAAAANKSGAEEQANPSCPASSQLGTVMVGAGPGSNPYYTSGRAYLAGPYKGAPLSLVFITPAVAGPFDLGNTVVRAATFLNSETTQITVKTDPLPQILDGVPLRLRSLSTTLDRSNFTLNPTNCEAMSISATIGGSNGASSSPSQPFQAGDCGALDFKPGLKLALKGKVSRRAHPSLTATLNPRPGDANIASAQVRLPKAAFLDNDNIGQVCTRPQFTAHQCPAGSIYGKATATTPLLGYTLAGPVYLRANPAHKLPDLVVGFNGPASQPIEIELAGKTDSVKGALRNTFEAVPDVPVSSFQLELFGGKKGLIEMSTGFCSNPKAAVLFTGQNGKVAESAPKVAAKCPKKKKSKKGKGKQHKRSAGAHSRR